MLETKRIKSSRQRDLVLCLIRSTHCHPTADWIYQKARMTLPHISLGTIYRNLTLLRDEGKIKELSYGRGVSRYDADLRQHYHVRCVECGSIEDVPELVPETSADQIEKLTGYQIHAHRLEFSGLCPNCKQTANRRIDNFSLSFRDPSVDDCTI